MWQVLILGQSGSEFPGNKIKHRISFTQAHFKKNLKVLCLELVNPYTLIEWEFSHHLVTGRLTTVIDFLPPTTWFLNGNRFSGV